MADDAPISKAEMVALLEAFGRQQDAKLGVLGDKLQETRNSLGHELLETRNSLRHELLETQDSLRHELLERIERTETKLLLEFRKWAVPMNTRQKNFEILLPGVLDRLSLVEERLHDLENPQDPGHLS